MDNFEEKEFTAGMIKSVEYIVQPLQRFIIASGAEMLLFSVYLGHLHSIELLFIATRCTNLGSVVL